MIEKIKLNKENYKFNIIGLFLVSLKKKYKRKDTFYCAEFVKYILETSLNKEGTLPEIIKPMDIIELDNMKLVYEGLLSKYSYRYELNFFSYTI